MKPWQRIVLACAVWQASFLFLYSASPSIAGLHDMILDLMGKPKLYDSLDLRPHMAAVFLFASTPSALLGLLVYRRSAKGPFQFQLQSVMFAIFGIALLLALSSHNDSGPPTTFDEGKAFGYFIYVVLLSCVFFRRLLQDDAETC